MTDNTPLNTDDGMKMPLGKRKLRELIEDAWYDAPSASAGFGRIEVIIEQQIEADRKKHDLQARVDELSKLGGFLFVGDIHVRGRHQRSYDDRIAELKQELEKL